MPKARRYNTVKLVGTVRRNRPALMMSTALQATAISVLATLPAAAQPAPNAHPTGGSVVAGAAAISRTSGNTQITQSTQRAAIDWKSFDVGSQQSVTFSQPSASAVALNRVTGPDPSQIAGRIDANGQIILLNQSGVNFYKGAQVNAAGVMVSTIGASDQSVKSFVASASGRLALDQPGNPNAMVDNQGNITIKQAGLAALVAPQVANSGTITAKLGHVVLAGAKTATLDLYGDGLLSLDVTNQVAQTPVDKTNNSVTALVTNTGVIIADGGTVQLTARAADGIVQTLVQAGGTIRAATAGGQTGTVALNGVGGSIVVEGQLAAPGTVPGTSGGSIVANATGTVTLTSGAKLNASGQAGGGTVAVGTTLARAKGGPGVTPTLTAANVMVQKGATIAANATQKGGGGRVTVLSAGTTTLAGSISARGGPAGGDGGFVETSGQTLTLGASATVDTRAPQGLTGMWQLDPIDWNIAITGGDETPAQVVAGLKTSNVTISADNDLTVTDAINAKTDPLATNSLIFQAGRSILVNASITMNGGSFTATANDSVDLGTSLADRSAGLGAFTMAAGVAIDTSVASKSIAIAVGPPSANKGGGGNFDPGTITLVGLATGGGAVTASGGVGLALTGSIDAGTGTVMLTSAGTITQTAAGAIIAATLTGSSSGGVDLSTATNAIGAIGAFTPSGDFKLDDGATPLQFTGAFAGAGDALTLKAGAVSQTAAGVITVATLTGSSSGGVDLSTATNAIGAIGAFAPGGNFNLNDGATPLQFTGAFAGAGDTLSLKAGAITQTAAGVITAATLTGSSSGGVDLSTATNAIGALGVFAPGGDFNLNDGATPLQFTGAFAGAGDTLTLKAGAISQNAAGVITAATLTGSSSGGVDLSTATNAIGAIGAFAPGGDYNLNDGATPLQFTGAFAGAGDTLTLKAGAISQTAVGVITAATLTGSSSGGVDLSTATNAIGAIGAFAPGGNFNLNDGATPLQFTGAFAGAGDTLSLKAGAISQTAAGAITAANFAITAEGPVSLLAANSVTMLAASVTDSGNGISFRDASTPLGVGTVGGIVGITTSDGRVALSTTTSGNVTVNSAIASTGGEIDIAAAPGSGFRNSAAIGSSGGNIVLLGDTLALAGVGATVNAGTGTVVLGPATTTLNVVLGAASTGTTLGLQSTDFATITAGMVEVGYRAEDATASFTGDISIGGAAGISLNPAGFPALLLVTGQAGGTVTQTQPVIFTAPGGTLGIIAGGNVSLTLANRVDSLAGFTDNSSAFKFSNGQALEVGVLPAQQLGIAVDGTTGLASSAAMGTGAGKPSNPLTGVTASAPVTLTTTTGGLTLGARVTASGQTVTLTSAGTITQTAAGAIIAATLTGSSSGGVDLSTATNAIGAIGAFTPSGDFKLDDGATPLQFTGAFAGAGDALTLKAGAVSQTAAGVITVATLTGSSSGGVDLSTATNAIGAIGAFAPGGNFNLNDGATPLLFTGAFAGAGDTLTLKTGAISQNAAGVITAATLTGSSSGGVDLSTATNAIEAIGAFAPGGDFNLNDGATPLQFAGTFAGAGDTLTVKAGAITQTAAGVITAATLTGSSSGGVDLSTATNAIGTLGAFALGGNFNLNDGATPLQFTGAFTGAGDTLTLKAGAITQTAAGVITAATLTGSSSAGVDLSTATNAIGAIGAFAPGGNFNLNDGATPLQFTGAFAGAGDTLTLKAGAITQTAAGAITAATLTGSSSGGVDLSTATNAIGAIGAFAPGGNFNLNDGATPLQFTGAFAGAGDTLTVKAGAISQTALGVITVATLTGSSSGGVDLSTATNAIGAIGAFAPGGNFNLNDDASPLQFTGAFAGAGDTLTLKAGAISQTAAGAITAGTLTGSSSGGVDLSTATNAIGALGAFAPGGNFNLNDGATPLQFTGAFAGAGDTLTLKAGAISQTAAGVITAGTLTGSSSGGVDLSTATNAIGTLGAFAPGGNFNLNDGATPLQFTGAFAGAGDTLTLKAGAISQTAVGAITAGTLTGSSSGGVDLSTATNAIGALGVFAPGGDFNLNDGATPLQFTGAFAGAGDTLTLNAGAISQTAAGVITVATLTGSSSGGVDLSTATNAIGTLGAFAPGGNFNLNDGATPLQFTGAFAGAGDTLTLNAGAISQTAAGVITAATLTGSSSGGVDLSTATNAIDAIGAFTPGGNFNLNDGATPLQFTGAFAGAGDTLTLKAGAISQTAAGAITVATLTGTAISASLTQPVNLVGTLGAFSTSAGFALTDNQALLVNGPVTDTGAASTLALTTKTGGITLAGTVSAANVVDLISAGTIGQVGGTLLGATLTGSAGASASLTQPGNLVGTLGAFSTAAGYALSDNEALLVNGPVVDTGAASTLALTTKTGDITLAGTVSAANIVDLISAGAISQTGGNLIAGTLTGSAASAAGLTQTVNQVGTLNGFTAAGFTLDDAVGLTVLGTVSGGPGATIGDKGPLAILGTVNATAVSLTADSITIPGNVAGTTVTLTSTVGAIGETGVLNAGSLTGSAVTTADLTGTSFSNSIGTLNGFTAAGFTLDNGIGLTVVGTVSGGPSATIADNGPLAIDGTVTATAISLTADSITIPGDVTGTSVSLFGTIGAIGETGVLNAGTLTGSAVTTANLTGTSFSNQIGTVSNFTASGFTLNNAADLTITGNVNGGPSVTIVDSKTITVATGGTITGSTVSAAANGNFNILGTVQDANSVSLVSSTGSITETGTLIAGVLTGSAAGDASLTGTAASNAVVQLDSFTSGGIFTLDNGVGLTINGPLTAPTIVIDTGANTMTLADKAVITTGGTPRPAGTITSFPGDTPALTTNGAFLTTSSGFTQQGSGTILGFGGGPAILRINANRDANITFDPVAGLQGTNTWLILNIGTGKSSGQIHVKNLDVIHNGQTGAASLSGTVTGLSGPAAAGASGIQPNPNANFRINSCPIGSVNCVLLPTQGVPTANPLNDINIGTLFNPNEDDDLLLPIVSDQDY